MNDHPAMVGSSLLKFAQLRKRQIMKRHFGNSNRCVASAAGFKRSTVYWEGDDAKGGGNGIFTKTEIGESCLSWIAYVVAEK